MKKLSARNNTFWLSIQPLHDETKNSLMSSWALRVLSQVETLKPRLSICPIKFESRLIFMLSINAFLSHFPQLLGEFWLSGFTITLRLSLKSEKSEQPLLAYSSGSDSNIESGFWGSASYEDETLELKDPSFSSTIWFKFVFCKNVFLFFLTFKFSLS